MAHINLLPWREELAKQKKQEFAFSAGGSVLVAALVVLMVRPQQRRSRRRVAYFKPS